MNRIQRLFNTCKSQDKKALIPYITAGDPDLKTTQQLMEALVAEGADILEIGVPFSDPVADGPVIQKAHARALKNQVYLEEIFELIHNFRKSNFSTPIVLMTYLNPIEIMGYDKFLQGASKSGIDGVLIVDMPLEENPMFIESLKAADIDPIFLLAPTTKENRIKSIVMAAKGYIYYVSLKGVTGANTLDINNVQTNLSLIRRYTDLPIAVGFGIRDSKTAAAIAPMADAVIVGSAYVALIEKYAQNSSQLFNQVNNLTKELRHALDGVNVQIHY